MELLAPFLPRPILERPQGDDLPVLAIRLRECKFEGAYNPIQRYYGIFIEVAVDDQPTAVELWTRAEGDGPARVLRALLEGRRSAQGGWMQRPMAPHVTPEFVRALTEMIEAAFQSLPDGIPASMPVES